MLVRSGNPESIEALASPFGKRVAIQVGTIRIVEAGSPAEFFAAPRTEGARAFLSRLLARG